MADHSIIMGTIEGISRGDYLELEPELQAIFDTVQWKDGAVVIRSERYHDRVRTVFQKLVKWNMIQKNQTTFIGELRQVY
jgi:hypothetical protein